MAFLGTVDPDDAGAGPGGEPALSPEPVMDMRAAAGVASGIPPAGGELKEEQE